MMELYDFYQDSPTRSKTRHRIIDSAVELFAEHGMEAVTMQNIAANCDITTRNLYRYYPNKEFLVVDAAFYVLGNITFIDLNPREQEKMKGIEQVEFMLKRMHEVEVSHENGIQALKFIMYFDLFLDVLDRSHPAYLLYTDKYVKHIQEFGSQNLERALKAGIADGSIRSDLKRPEQMVEYMVQSLVAITMRATIKVSENEAINQELVEEHIHILIEYLKTKE